MKLLTKNFERIVWIGAILLVIFLFKRCSDKKSDEIKAIQTAAKELQQQRQQDSINFIQQVHRWQDSITTANLNSDLQVRVIKETEKKLQASQSRIKQLSDIVRNSNNISNNSNNSVLVTWDYKRACDSLPNEIDKQNILISELQQDNTDLVDLMNYEVIYRDSLIETGRGYIDSLRADYNRQTSLLNTALKAGKPRGRLLGGVGLIGNEVNPLSGTKINIAYQSKGGKQYQIGGLLMRGGVYYEATVLITLIK